MFEVSGKRLKIVQEISWDEHFGGTPIAVFDNQAGTFTFTSAQYLPGDAHCCVSDVDVVTVRWSGLGFGESSVRTELSDYWRRQVEVLP